MTAARITESTVRETFETFVEVAQRAGFDTEHWMLQKTAVAWYHWTRKRPDGSIGGAARTEFRQLLGYSPRDAYVTLSTRIDTLIAVYELAWANLSPEQKQTAARKALGMIPPHSTKDGD